MAKLTLTFQKPGVATTIQDHGRKGYQHLGVSVGGPLDRQSAMLANKLVGNKNEVPVIEATLIGPEIKFDCNCLVAITGGNLTPSLNGNSLKMYSPILVNAGDVLSFGKTETGCRCYIAIAGEWLLEKWLGSMSTTTHQPDTFTPDSVVKKNSKITIRTAERDFKTLNTSVKPKFKSEVEIRVLPGPEYELFRASFIEDVFNRQHELSNDCNRMAYRLKGSINGFTPAKELISSGIIPGTIQITNEGQPIILLADAQTTGGYYRVANVIDKDLDILGQLKPGDKISFKLIK